jgi:hypothetical protein
MALVVATLQAALTKIFKSYPSSPKDCADQMSQAYADYAAAGQAAGEPIILTGSEKTLLAATLLQAISVPAVGNPATLAAAWSVGYTAFWMAPPVACVTPFPGIVTLATGAPALISALTACFANLTNTPETCAATMAAALDVATKLVIVTIIVPPGIPTPSPLV